MRIIVDADATPGISLIEQVAINYELPCILIADDTHVLKSDYSEIVTVSKGAQSVDMYLVNMLESNDIVISQDYGVAVIGLSKHCHVINTKGNLYTDENIDSLLASRHLSGKLRRQGHHTKGPKKRTKEDDIRLQETMIHIIEKEKK